MSINEYIFFFFFFFSLRNQGCTENARKAAAKSISPRWALSKINSRPSLDVKNLCFCFRDGVKVGYAQTEHSATHQSECRDVQRLRRDASNLPRFKNTPLDLQDFEVNRKRRFVLPDDGDETVSFPLLSPAYKGI